MTAASSLDHSSTLLMTAWLHAVGATTDSFSDSTAIELQNFQHAADVRLRTLNKIKVAGAEQLAANQSTDRQLIEMAELAGSEESK